jgi:hypothetical protein
MGSAGRSYERQECVDRLRRPDGGHSREELPATQLLIIRAIMVARSMLPRGPQNCPTDRAYCFPSR